MCQTAFLLLTLAMTSEDVIAQSGITRVDVFIPSSETRQPSLTLSGTVEAKQHAQLAPLQEGVVEEIYVEQGEQVVAGQKLLQLDAKLAQLQLQRFAAEVRSAEVAKTEAKRLYKEVLGLSEKQLVAKTQMEERFSAVAVAEADFNRATALFALQQEVLARHTLYAPFTGVIAQRHINLGEWVTQQRSVFTLVQQQDLRLALQVPQEYHAALASAEQVPVKLLLPPELTPRAKATDPYTSLQLSRIVSVVNSLSRTLTVHVDLPDHVGWLAGMSARAEILLPDTSAKTGEAITWLPKSALKQHPDGGQSVFTVEQNRAKRHLVKVVERQGQRVAVLGVPAQQSVVISGIELLQEDEPIQVQQILSELP